MLSHLDRILYPTRCEVIEIVPSQRYVFPIFKNGSSSLNVWSESKRVRILFNQQIKNLSTIDVIIRDPESRLVSGINTYIQLVLRDNPELDPATVEWFAINHFWLNRHYGSQFSWLLSLARYLDHSAHIRFFPMSEIQNITQSHRFPRGIDPVSPDLAIRIQHNNHAEIYQRLDRALFDLIGNSHTWKETLQYLQQKDKVAYEYVIGYTKSLTEPLYVLP